MTSQNICRIFALIISLLITAPPKKADSKIPNPNMAGRDTLVFSHDFINFASSEQGQSKLIIYTKISFDDLQFIKNKAKKFEAQFEILATVFDLHGVQLASKKEKETITVNTIDEASSTYSYKLSKLIFDLEPGEVRVKVRLKDLETENYAEPTSEITLRDFTSSNEIAASDLLYLDYLSTDAKGKIDFLPRVSSSRYDDSNIYAFFELYNLPENDSVLVNYEIVDGTDSTLIFNKYWIQSEGRITRSFIEIGGLTLPHGKYNTKITVQIPNDTLRIGRLFDWYIDGVPKTFGTLDEAIEVLRYIATDKEMEYMTAPDLHEKYHTFVNFWRKRDPTPQTSVNELRNKYYQRVVYANGHFRGAHRDGWNTDMGWVYVMVGPPDQIERDLFNMDSAFLPGKPVKAVQQWIYYKYNRQLVFFDEIGFGDYRLSNPEILYEMLR